VNTTRVHLCCETACGRCPLPPFRDHPMTVGTVHLGLALPHRLAGASVVISMLQGNVSDCSPAPYSVSRMSERRRSAVLCDAFAHHTVNQTGHRRAIFNRSIRQGAEVVDPIEREVRKPNIGAGARVAFYTQNAPLCLPWLGHLMCPWI